MGLTSTINLAALSSWSDPQSGSPSGDAASSELTASNSGLIVMGATNTLLTGVLATVQTGGAITANLQLLASTLQGSGTITGNVINGGKVDPGVGTATGILTISGNYTQFGGGSIAVALGGTTAGSTYNRLAIGGSATLNGALGVSLTGGFTPALADAFQVVTFGSRSGDFGTYTGLGYAANRTLRTTFNAANLTLARRHRIFAYRRRQGWSPAYWAIRRHSASFYRRHRRRT